MKKFTKKINSSRLDFLIYSSPREFLDFFYSFRDPVILLTMTVSHFFEISAVLHIIKKDRIRDRRYLP